MNTASNDGNSLDQTEIRFLVEKNADGIIVVDEHGSVLFANPAAEAIFGRSLDSLIGSPIGIPVIAGDTAEIAIHKPGGEKVDAEIRVVETIWNHRSARLASLRDISVRRAVEERLRHSAKMEAIGRLTAGIAHDFNNLLTVVLGNLETARRQSALAEAALLRALDNATRGAQRAATLTERLLAFARRKPLEPRVVDINALVAGMSDLLQRTLGEEVSVRLQPASDLWPVEADPTELEAAILNLAVNARDAMPSGGDLLIETANVMLTPDPDATNLVAPTGPYVCIAVTDTGVGMTPEVLKQVFEPFFTTKGGHGTGLGLSQVYGFATQSGGHAKLDSRYGIGTTARIYLPRADHLLSKPDDRDAGHPTDGEPYADDSLHSRAGEVILVVEDDDDVRSYTVTCLRELGYVVFEAAHAASALEIVRREPALRLLLTDLGLPGGTDGRALSEQARLIRPNLKVLITTAYAASMLIQNGRLDPAVDLLSKPFTFASLAGRVRDLLAAGGSNEMAVPPTLLVVEDEILVRMLLVEALAAEGYQVEEAGNFREAVQKFDTLGSALTAAIVDVGLPDRPGDAFVQEIRATRPDLPIILVTGYADHTLHERVLQDARVQIVGKPFQPSDVAAALKRFGLHPAKPSRR